MMKSSLYRDSQENLDRLQAIKERPDQHLASQDTCIEEFLDEFPEYWEYIRPLEADVPEFSYGFFGRLPKFIALEYKNGNIDLVQRIFLFLEKMGKSEDIMILNLLLVGCLECFDHQKDVLPELVELMPKDLKALFLEHFGEYLD